MELDPAFAKAHLMMAHIFIREGKPREALLEFEKAIRISGREPEYVSALGHYHAVSGHREDAQRILEELKGLA